MPFFNGKGYAFQHLDDLHGYMDWINTCRVLITNDSLGLYLGIALGKKVIALFGPTPSDTWKPPSEQVRVLQSPTGSMEGLGVDQVWSALQGAAISARGRGGVGPSAAVTDS